MPRLAVQTEAPIVGVRLPPAWRDALAARARAQGNTLSVQIRLALYQYLEREGIQV